MMYKWQIPDGYWKTASSGKYESHEAICLLNTTDEDAEVKMTLYFEDRPKMDGFAVKVAAERTLHVRMDQIKNKDGLVVPADMPYAVLLESNVNLSVQYTRVDSSQEALTIASTVIG